MKWMLERAERRKLRGGKALASSVTLFILLLGNSQRSIAQGVSSGEIRPFVVGLVPVVGFGGVGGVSIDAKGVVARSDVEALGRLREARLKALMPLDSQLQAVSRMRKISLRRLQAAIDERRRSNRPIDDALQNLAGLTRVEFVFVYPEQNDIVVAGPAEGWMVDATGNVAGRTSGQPVLPLDDF